MRDPAPTSPPPHALLRWRIAAPFLLVALIWGSTWYVITGQISEVAPSWSVAYRFALATPAMFALALATGKSLAMPRAGHGLALALGLFQFCCNFNFVYRSEEHLTSGIVAVMFALLMVPNALLARALLGQRITPRFIAGSAVAIAGVALLLVEEARSVRLAGDVPLGVALAIGGLISASVANVIQANETGRSLPMLSLLAWAMLYGTVIDIALAWATAGAPVFPTDGAFWAGTAWLALAGSVVTFPLYYGIVRAIGAGRAAYNAVLVVVIAMLISTFVEGYAWTPLAVAGAVLGTVGMLIALRAKSAPTPPPTGEGDHAVAKRDRRSNHGGGAQAAYSNARGHSSPKVPLHHPAGGPPPRAGEDFTRATPAPRGKSGVEAPIPPRA